MSSDDISRNDQSQPAPSPSIPSRAVNPEEVRGFAEMLGLRSPIVERCSTQFLFLLYCGALGVPLGDPNRIVAEVRVLEGLNGSIAKPAEEFDRPPLRGFWRKHYVLGGLGSFAVNVKLGMGKNNRELRRIVRKSWKPGTVLSVETVRNMSSEIVGLYKDRAMMGELTGEWIIFARDDEQNYYLTLATHAELKADGGAAIVERIKGCIGEFPFLADMIESSTS
jgi:hypothetical protein